MALDMPIVKPLVRKNVLIVISGATTIVRIYPFEGIVTFVLTLTKLARGYVRFMPVDFLRVVLLDCLGAMPLHYLGIAPLNYFGDIPSVPFKVTILRALQSSDRRHYSYSFYIWMNS